MSSITSAKRKKKRKEKGENQNAKKRGYVVAPRNNGQEARKLLQRRLPKVPSKFFDQETTATYKQNLMFRESRDGHNKIVPRRFHTTRRRVILGYVVAGVLLFLRGVVR